MRRFLELFVRVGHLHWRHHGSVLLRRRHRPFCWKKRVVSARREADVNHWDVV